MEESKNFFFKPINVFLLLAFFEMHIATYAQTIKRWKAPEGRVANGVTVTAGIHQVSLGQLI